MSFGPQLHDIPNTVKSAMKVLSQLGVDMTNVHAAGGVEMMRAREGLGTQANDRCDHLNVGKPDAGFSKYPNHSARVCDSLCQRQLKRAWMVSFARLQEVQLIKQATNSDFICLTPRFVSGSCGWRPKRVMTPADAYQIGSDYIVVGRPITQAEDPAA